MAVLGLALSMRTLNLWDESWFVQVVSRMRDGDVLYRDIAYGAGPLPAYLTEGLTYLVGVDVLAEKLVVIFTFAATATLAWAVTRRIGLGRGPRLLVLGALLYLGPPAQEPPYAPLATTLMLCALVAALVYRTSESARRRTLCAVAGGAACGLGFVCKQNVGAYALAAVVILILVERRVRDVLWAIAAAVATAGLVLLPVIASGGFPRYLDYGFTGKGEYVQHGFGFGTGLDFTWQTIRDVHSPASAEVAYWSGRFFFPVVAAAALLLLTNRRRWRQPETLPIAVFAVVTLITLYPRFDTGHVAYAAPLLVLLVAFVLRGWSGRLPRAASTAAALWFGLAVAIAASLPLRLTLSPEANLSDLPHLRGTFVQASDLARWHRDARQLVAAARGRETGLLVLTPDAGFRYLSSGLENPTAFDFPFVTTFGRNGERRVIDALASGRIKRVCLAGEWYGLGPPAVIAYVRSTMLPGADLGFCRVYG
jgi:4-amino-4-deoxy-L-arabinose transferase-like glycosyltransferase